MAFARRGTAARTARRARAAGLALALLATGGCSGGTPTASAPAPTAPGLSGPVLPEAPSSLPPGGLSLPVAGGHAPETGEREDDLPGLTTAQALQRATRVALVRVTSTRVVEGAPGTPFTRTEVRVLDVLKGRLAPRFALQVIGGRLGDVVVESPVRPFRPGSRYVLFLGPDGPVGPTLVPQAVLEVVPAPGGDVVTPPPTGLRLVPAPSSTAPPSRSRPRLDDVLHTLRLSLAGATAPTR